MYDVLMPVDTGERRARAQARFVSGLPNASNDVAVMILFVFSGEADELPDDFQRYKSADRIAAVRRAREQLEAGGIAVTTTDRSGTPAEVILKEIAETDPDVVVLGGRKRSAVETVLFGSVAQEVILDTDRPVVVTGSAPDTE